MPSNKILKVLLLLFIATSITVGTIIVIIIARGGQIDGDGLKTNTGMVRLHVMPETLEYKVYVGEKEVSITDKRINSLTEGEYTIRIESTNFTTWENKVTVQNDLVTDVFVKLYPIDLKISQTTNTNIDKAFFSSNGEYVYYSVINSELGKDKGLWSLQLNDSASIFGSTQAEPIKILGIDTEISKSLLDSKFEIIPNADNSKALYIDRTNNLFYVINSNQINKTPLSNISYDIGYAPGNAYWFNSNQNILFIDEKVIFDFNLNDKTKTLVYYSNNPIIYAVNENQLLILDSNNKLLTYKDKKLSQVDISGMTLPANINSMIGTKSSDILFTKSTDGEYTYVDIKKLFKKTIDTSKKYDLVEVNSTADVALLKDESGNYSAFIAFENKALNKIDTKIIALFADSKLVKGLKPTQISFSSTGSHILSVFNVENSDKLIAVEKDGGNEIKLLENQGKTINADFNSKGNYLYLLLESTDDGVTRVNLHKMLLEK